jgi:hypothetical protein
MSKTPSGLPTGFYGTLRFRDYEDKKAEDVVRE